MGGARRGGPGWAVPPPLDDNAQLTALVSPREPLMYRASVDAPVMIGALLVGVGLAWGVVRHLNAPEQRSDAAVRLRPTDRARLLPRIRTHAYIDQMRARGATGDDAIVYDPLAGELIVAYGIDGPSTFRMVTERDLPHLEIDRAELWAIATENM